MEFEEAKKELRSYRELKEYYAVKQQDIGKLEAQLERTSMELTPDQVQGSNLNRVENLLAELMDLKIEQLQILADAEKKKVYIERKISQLDQPFRNILYFKYILDWSMTKIAFKMDYAYKWLSSLHVEAIKKYSEII